jgi:hypothetical protein
MVFPSAEPLFPLQNSTSSRGVALLPAEWLPTLKRRKSGLDGAGNGAEIGKSFLENR